MMRWFLIGLSVPVALFGAIWVIDQAAGTWWALPVALVCVAVVFGWDTATRAGRRV